MRSRFSLIALLLLGGCSVGTDPAEVSLAGCWSETFSVPGAGLSLVLTEAQSAITGGGHFSIEAGPSGSLTAAGNRSGGDFSLTLTYDIGMVRQFSGKIRNQNRFDAYLLDASGQPEATPAEFRRCTLP
jgi:hypothetical protein